MFEDRHRIVRIDRSEFADMPAGWTSTDRGQYLRMLLQLKGIDTARLYRVEYYPLRGCWVLTQEIEPPRKRDRERSGREDSDAAFFLRAASEFRRSAVAAFAAQEGRSTHFAKNGAPYELPAKPQDLSAAELKDLLGKPAKPPKPAQFNPEGGWRGDPLAN